MFISKPVEDGIIDHNEFLAKIKEKKQYDDEKNEGDKSKLSEAEIVLKNKFFSFFSIINMVFITAEVFAENCIYTIKKEKKR